MPPRDNGQVREIIVRGDTKGARELRDFAKSLGGINQNVKKLSGDMGFLTSAFQAYIGAISIQQLAGFSDQIQQLRDRINVFTGSSNETARVMEGLLATANRTKTSLDGLSTIYSRLAASTEETGISTAGLLDLTEVLQNSFRLSGATAGEATAAAVQLSQGFASGQLRGQELRSVMEQNVVVAKLLRKEFGNDVYEKASKGLISAAQVMKILFQNADDLEKQAAKLGATFGQTLTVSLNDVQMRILKFNDSMGLSEKFAVLMAIAVDNLGTIITTVATVAMGLMIKQLILFAATLKNMERMSVIIGILQVLVIVGALIYENWDKVVKLFTRVKATFLGGFGAVHEAIAKTAETFAKFLGGSRFFEQLAKEHKAAANEVKNEAIRLNTELGRIDMADAKRRDEESIQRTSDRNDLIEQMNKLMAQQTGKQQKLKEILADINKEYLKTKDVEAYFRAFDEFEITKLNREFKEGKTNLTQFNQAKNEFDLRQFNRDFREGAISAEQFRQAVEKNRIEDLNIKLRAGIINLKEYNVELAKLKDGLSLNTAGAGIAAGAISYIESIGTVGNQIASSINKSFSSLEDSLTESLVTLKLDFKDFTKAILDDLARIVIRASIIRPLAEGIGGWFGSTAATRGTGTAVIRGQPSVMQAYGGVWENGIQKFARGGIVSSPTLFNHAGGQGLMGEAGAEAILPLSRGRSGNLGVEASVTPVTINVINTTGADVKQTETTGPNGERIIEMMIQRKVAEGLANGTFDKPMKTSYGLNRRGF